jgi:hyperosmotically inducible protein
MKSTIFSLICAVALLTGPISARLDAFQDTAVRATDHTLNERIETRVGKDPALKPYSIKVSVDGGVATLTGTVASRSQRKRAAQLARVTGITRVDNQIVVDRSAGSAASTRGIADNAKEAGKNIKEAGKEVGGAAKDGAAAVGEKTREGAEKTKEGAAKVGDKTLGGVNKVSGDIGDTAIVGRVKARFVGEDLLKGSDIKVDSNQHVVTLRGTVASEAGRSRAIEIANSIDSVQRVVDQLTVGPKR